MNKNYQNQEQMTVADYKVEQQPVADEAMQTEIVPSNPYARLEEWLQEFFGKSFKLDTPESQEKLKEFFRSNI